MIWFRGDNQIKLNHLIHCFHTTTISFYDHLKYLRIEPGIFNGGFDRFLKPNSLVHVLRFLSIGVLVCWSDHSLLEWPIHVWRVVLYANDFVLAVDFDMCIELGYRMDAWLIAHSKARVLEQYASYYRLSIEQQRQAAWINTYLQNEKPVWAPTSPRGMPRASLMAEISCAPSPPRTRHMVIGWSARRDVTFDLQGVMHEFRGSVLAVRDITPLETVEGLRKRARLVNKCAVGPNAIYRRKV